MPSVSTPARAEASGGDAGCAHRGARHGPGYGSFVLIRELDFTIRRGDIFVIMGGMVAVRARSCAR